MKNQNLKKVVSLVAGSLVIALVVSILPGGFLASAAEVSIREAKNVAIDYINDESAEIVEIDDDGLDEDKPHYKVKIKTDKSEYTLVVDAETAEIKLDSRKRLDTAEVVTVKDFDDFEEFKKFIRDDDFDDYGIDKPTAEAELNQVIKEGKKVAIADYKEAKEDLDKDDDDYKENKTLAKVEFKDAKNDLKEIKKDAKEVIKTEKIDDNDNDDDNEDDDKDQEKDIVGKAKIDEKQALIIALKKIGVPVTDAKVSDLAKLNSEDAYEDLFKLTNLDIEIDDDNPPAYELEFEYDGNKYEITIHAISGAILDYERESLDKEKVIKEEKVKEEKEDNDDDKDDDDDSEKTNNGNNGNGKGNKK